MQCHKQSHLDSPRMLPIKNTHNLITSIVNHQQGSGSKTSVCSTILWYNGVEGTSLESGGLGLGFSFATY